MKLRFRGNSLRLRLNQSEVVALAEGKVLREQIDFPGNAHLCYSLTTHSSNDAQALFADGNIKIALPSFSTVNWCGAEEIGLYYRLPTSGATLSLAIEKDLECIDGPADEKDPLAFPRELTEKVC